MNESGNGHGALNSVAHRIGNLDQAPVLISVGKRARRVRRAVRLSLREWRAARLRHPAIESYPTPTHPNGNQRNGDFVKSLPRRKKFNVEMDAYAGPPMMRKLVFKAKHHQVVKRLFEFAKAVARWYLGRFKDRLRGKDKDTDETRAVRLREIIQDMEGTAVKIGQQLAMRIDLMPYAYGVELSKLLDDGKDFDGEFKAAHKIIEKLLGPLDKVFQSIDPTPIGKASVACVYQAVLKNGDRVAVKVRRPHVGEDFVADCRALTWVLRLMEFLTLIPPGLARNFLFEFETMLLEELDFVKEARNTELFRRRVLKKLDHVTGARVYFEFSGEEVLTTEYVEGLWLREMIAGIEQKNPEVLAHLRTHNIDPKIVARRLIRTNQFGIFENLLFHADPHPSNVLIWPNSTLVFIDFGSCGAYTTRERNNWRQLAYYQSKEDIGRMVQSALAVLEPLPAIDLDEFTKKLEAVFWRDLYAFKSDYSEWWERTSARTWMSFLELAHEYQIPMNLNTLRMIRSTLLYETVAARIYPRVNAYREHRKYNKQAGKRARKRVNRTVRKRLFGGLTDTDYLRVEQVMQMGNRLIYLAQRILDAPPFRYALLIGKVADAVIHLFKEIRFVGLSLIAAFFGVIAYRLMFEDYSIYQFEMKEMLQYMLFKAYRMRAVWIIVALVALWLNWRRTRFRLSQKEIHRDNTSGLS